MRSTYLYHHVNKNMTTDSLSHCTPFIANLHGHSVHKILSKRCFFTLNLVSDVTFTRLASSVLGMALMPVKRTQADLWYAVWMATTTWWALFQVAKVRNSQIKSNYFKKQHFSSILLLSWSKYTDQIMSEHRNY